MKQVWDLSYLYLLGHLRRHVYAGSFLVGLVLLALPSYVSAFSLGINSFERVSKDFGLTMIGFYSALLVVLLGSTSVPRDLQSRACYPALSGACPLDLSQRISVGPGPGDHYHFDPKWSDPRTLPGRFARLDDQEF